VAQAARDLMSGGAAGRRWLPPALRDGGSQSQRLKALLPVHVFGQPASMTALATVAREHGLSVIEDACEAIGAVRDGVTAGQSGDVAAFAFYPNKQMTTGEGGVIVTDRDDWADVLRSLRNQGRDVFDAWLNHSRLGYNYRMTELSAAIGLVQIRRLDELLAKRARVADWYCQRLSGLAEMVELPHVGSDVRMSWFVFVVRLAPPLDRGRLMTDLANRGVPTRPYFTPIHLQPFYRERFGCSPGDLPVTEDLAARSLALPFSSVMTEEQVDYVCGQVEVAVKSLAG
jgi:dTDP-4-amino-4,6-dideoxygalactose transaminase